MCYIHFGLGDNSFADSCDSGLKKAENDFGIIYDQKQLDYDDYDQLTDIVRATAQEGYDVVVAGYDYEIRSFLDEESMNYPDTIFALYDSGDTSWVPNNNVVSIVFKSNEADFVAGAVAAKQSAYKVTGWVGGQEYTSLSDYLVGWAEGVKYADETATTAYSWVAGNAPWSDPDRAKELANALHNNYRADIFHAVAGMSGDGVIALVNELRAAGDNTIWDIGVDSDQYSVFMANGREDKAEGVLTSAVKKVEGPVYNLIQALAEGRTPAHGTQMCGIADGAAGIAENSYFSANATEGAKSIIRTIEQEAKAGTLVVDTAYGLSTSDLDALLAELTINHVAQEEPAPLGADVVVGVEQEPSCDMSYGAFEYGNNTDRALLDLTDDCLTVTTSKEGDYVINQSVVDSYTRTVDEDNNVTYTFRIKQGLVFNDGSPITAENFLAWSLLTLSRVGKDAGTNSYSWDYIPGGMAYHEGETNILSGLRLLGEYEFSQTINAIGAEGTQYLPYYYELSYAVNRAISLDYWFGSGWSVRDDGAGAYLVNTDGKGIGDALEHVQTVRYETSGRVTAGPYNLVSYDPETKEILLERNALYAGDYQGQKPTIETIKLVYLSEEDAFNALQNGTINMASGFSEGSRIAEQIGSGSMNGVATTTYQRAGYGYVQFVCDFGPMQYKEFRQAFAWLLDRDEFSNEITYGNGVTVDGPYTPEFSMYKENEEYLEENLTHYTLDVTTAVSLLKSIGFVYNADGSEYADGSGEVRYKEVTAEEAANYDTVEVNGKLLMPAKVKWAATQNNSVSDLLREKLIDSGVAAQAGILIEQDVVSFTEMLNYMYREDFYGLGGDYSAPVYSMYNLSTGWNSGVYDYSNEFTTNPDYIQQGYNTSHLYDEELNSLSMDMVHSVEAGDFETYLDLWRRFVVRYNDELPSLPIYCNLYTSVYPTTISGYEETAFWSYSRALVYATYA